MAAVEEGVGHPSFILAVDGWGWEVINGRLTGTMKRACGKKALAGVLATACFCKIGLEILKNGTFGWER
jgi:hypothetical protein